ncbi:MAG: lysostaphin resistance A-like protein [Planctomycetota bacterium]|jgi:membrane protease YdiL (CAAX protease family)
MNDQTNPYTSPQDRFETAELVEVVEVVEEPATPWGFWFTVLFSVVVLVVFIAIQTAVAIPFVLAEMQRQPGVSPQTLTENLEANGLLLSLATLFSAPACIALTLLFAKLRRPISVRQYLGLKPVAKRAIVFWCLSVVLFMLLTDALSYLATREVVPSQMTTAYQTAGFLPLLWFAVICLAPLFEEIFFRGFLFSGIRHSRLGGPLAILITALVWAGIHVQYDAYQVSVIFAGGLLLGMARLKTDSVYVTIAMHVIWNIIAMVETAIVVGW